MKNIIHHRFSLLEILIAVAILALSLGGAISLFSTSQSDVVRARNRWLDQHALEQATEYFLMANPDNLDIADGVLPDGYRASCSVVLPEGADLEAETVKAFRGWALREYRVELETDTGERVREMSVYKIIRDDSR